MSALKKPILVVDDHEDTRDMVCTMLRAEGFLVVEAVDGKAALDLLESEARVEPCLIVTDVEMPVMTGWDLLTRLEVDARLASIPVVVASGTRSPTEARRFPAVVAYFPKPVDLMALKAKVKEVALHHCEKA